MIASQQLDRGIHSAGTPPPCPAWLLPAIALTPASAWFINRLDDGSDEPLGLLVLALALFLAWRDRRSLHAAPPARTFGALVILASVLSIGFLPPLLRAALAVAGTGLWFGIHRRAGLLGLLGLSLPVVASLQFYAGYPMRLAAAEGAVKLLELTGTTVVRNGVNIELGGQLIGVDPACSGVRMLWHALAAAMALCAIHRASWRSTLSAGLLAILLVIPANVLRAAWLALVESGRFHGIDPGHGNTGLLCFAVLLIPLWAFVSSKANPKVGCAPSAAPRAVDHAILLAAGIFALASFFLPAPAPDSPPPFPSPAEFTFNGLTLPLDPLPPSAAEQAFAKNFPGSLSSHRCGTHQVILRHVTTATRMLHPSRDCLRAAGFETTDSITVRSPEGEWARFSATRDGERFNIHERIVSEQDGSSWTDVQSWYWSALWHPLNGPWRAETVISH